MDHVVTLFVTARLVEPPATGHEDGVEIIGADIVSAELSCRGQAPVLAGVLGAAPGTDDGDVRPFLLQSRERDPEL